MQTGDGNREGSPPRQKPAFLAALAIPSFASFTRSQAAAQPLSQPQVHPQVHAHAPDLPVVQSPVRRKPLPPGSPVVGRYSPAELKGDPGVAPDKSRAILNRRPSQDPRRPAVLPSPSTTPNVIALIPRNLDE